MEDNFIETDTSLSTNGNNSGGKFNSNEIVNSSITQMIGRGDDARNSFVYLTLRYAFIVGLLITFLLVLNNWLFRIDEKTPNLMNDILSTWEIVIPLITLALGYAFGKSKD